MITSLPLAFGLLMGVIGLIFYTSGLNHIFWNKFYAIVPAIVLCCFIPATLNTLGLFSPDIGRQVYAFSASWLLPAALFLMTLSMDILKLIGLGWKILVMFFVASIAIILAGPLALWTYKQINSGAFGDDTLWRSFSAVAGSWIGGAANQAAMKELFHIPQDLFGIMILVDTSNASLWLLVIFILAKRKKRIDDWLRADTRAINRLIQAVNSYEAEHARITSLRDFMLIFGITFAVVGLSDWLGKAIAEKFLPIHWASHYSLSSGFFWMVICTTIFGVLLSLTPARKLDYVGAGKIGTVFIYILIAAIGMQINLQGIREHWSLILVGTFWMFIHVVIIFIFAYLIRAPLFYLCVASNANIGGASSAPIVATAFHPALAPVGVLLGILGYTVGTIGGYISTLLMRFMVS